MRRFIARIDFDDPGFFVNDLRLIIAEPIELVRDLFEIRLANNDADQFFAASS